MRVLVLFRSKVLVDRGTPLRARNLVKALRQLPGVEVMLLSQDDSTVVQETLSVAHHQLERQMSEVSQLMQCINAFHPDVIYGQTHKGLNVLGRLPDIPYHPLVVVDLHGDRAAQHFEREDKSLAWRTYWSLRARFEERKFGRRVDGFTVVSHNLAHRVASYNKPVHLLWGGVDLEQFRPPPPHTQIGSGTNGRVHVAYAGNYRPYQGVSFLLQAASRLAVAEEPFHFTFIGNIEAYPEQASIAHSLGNYASLLGQIPFLEIPACLGQADVLVTPRADGRGARYSYPSKLSEQLAMGKAVIVTDVGEAGQLAQHGKTGLVIRPNSVDDMVEALLSLKNESLRQKLGQAARGFAEENLAWPLLARNLVAYFQELSSAAT